MSDTSEIQASVTKLRTDYHTPKLSITDMKSDPLDQFTAWLDVALAADIVEPHAMSLATATRTGIPSVRVVLLRGFDKRGFVFFTNYESQKAQELGENPNAAAMFYWGELHRQVRITGQVSQLPAAESDAYFQTRPRGSKIGAWASKQSQAIASRAELEANVTQYEEKFRDKDIPRPLHWGGYRLLPRSIEFWQGRPSRLHDRFRYTRREPNVWVVERLSP